MKKVRLISWSLLLLLFVSSFVVSASEPLVSTVFFESDVRDAINELVFQTGINIIMDETVRGVITLDLQDVPLEKALSMISLSGGFSFRKIDDFYFLGIADPKSSSFQHLVETESLHLQYISQDEARALLSSVYDDYLRSSPERDVITITAPQELREKFKKDVSAIDQPLKQVLIQAIVTEISHDALNEYGINLLDFTKQGSAEIGSDWRGMRLSSELGETLDTFSFRTNFFNYGDLFAQLRMLESENKAKIKANPKVLVNDRGTVELFSGQTQHLILADTGTSSRLEAVDVGISLKATPKILNGDELEIIIAPEISHFVNDKYNSKTGLAVRRNEVSTSVYVQNGQMIVLAGLTIEEQSDLKSQVPILGSIPLVRWFFSNSTERVEERELVVFLIAEIQ